MIAIRVEASGCRLRLRNVDGLHASFADLERRGDRERRVTLEPGETKVIPLQAGMVYLTVPRGVEYETLP